MRSLSWMTLMLFLVGSTAAAADRPPDLDEKILAFEKSTGIDIHVMGDSSEVNANIPENWGPVDPAMARKAIPVLEEVVLRYPSTIRGTLLKDIYLFGKLQMNGKPFLGMARPDNRRLDLGIRPRTSMVQLRSTCDHEIAHIVEMNNSFPADEWVSLSGKFSGRLDKQPETKNLGQDVWLAKGFVNRYASKNRHEDFAEMAELGFAQPAKLGEFTRDYPQIERKVDLMTEVYHDFAPGMNLPWTPGPDPARDRGPTTSDRDPTPPTVPPPAPGDDTPETDTGGPSADTGSPPPASSVSGSKRRLDDNGNPTRASR